MIKRLTDREKRTVKLGSLCAVAILAFVYMPRWTGHWRTIRSEIARMEQTLDEVRDPLGPRQAGLTALVPVFQMPAEQETQIFLFRDKVDEQIKQAGLNEEPLQMDISNRKTVSGYLPLYLNYEGQCRFEKLLDLLVTLKGNPYCVGVESLKIECDPKKPAQDRGDLDVELTVSTFAKKKAS